MDEMKKLGREDILVVVGGVVPSQDYKYLYDKGVVGVFGPGTPVSEAAVKLLEILISTIEE